MGRSRLDRRLLLAGALASTASGPRAWAQATGRPAAAPAWDPQVLATLVREGYVFSLPLMEVCRTRDRALAAGLPPNRFNHRRALTGPADRGVTTPNTDTLYSTAFLDLRKAPVTLTCPASPGRYISLALMDAWSNNFHIAGTRTDGGRAARLVLATEDQAKTVAAEPGTRVVVSPTKWVWALGRVLVDGPADLDAAHRVQDGITAQGEAGGDFPKAPPRDAPVAQLLSQGQTLAGDTGVLKADMGTVMGFMRRSLVMGIDVNALTDPAQIAAAQVALDEARASLRAATLGGPRPVGGWTYPKPNLGDFGVDYPYRAAVAVAGLAALPPVEAMYMTAVGEGPGGAFDGRRNWRLDLPRLPVDGFWSLTLYERTPEGGLFFFDNPLKRYAVGDRTPGLVRDAGGGCSLAIGAADPGEARRANWLPAPAGPFVMILRAYLPRPELMDGRFRLPAVAAA